jgi:CheY-like chemotaxis protein
MDQEAQEALQPGTAIEARHGGKATYYPGKIHENNGDGTYKVLYDDGDREIRVTRDLIKVAVVQEQRSESPAAVFRILVVDDEPFALEILVEMFEDAPYPVKVESAGGPKEASAILESKELDLVLMDYHLEVGFDTAEYLVEFDKRNVPVVVMSGDADCAAINECIEKKLAVDYLVKPITCSDIVNMRDAGVKKLRPSKNEAEEADEQAEKGAEEAEEQAKNGIEEAQEALQPGTAIEARHGGKATYYPGKIHEHNGDGTYKVLYDDGDREIRVTRDLIKAAKHAKKEGDDEVVKAKEAKKEAEEAEQAKREAEELANRGAEEAKKSAEEAAQRAAQSQFAKEGKKQVGSAGYRDHVAPLKVGSTQSLLRRGSFRMEQPEMASVFRVMVVDDNPFDREIIVDMFEDAPYPVEIESAGCQEEASAILESMDYEAKELDLVLMDYHLEINFDTAEYLLEFYKRNIPVVVMSGDDNVLAISECLEQQLAVDYLVKPITARDIANMRRYTKLHKMRREQALPSDQSETDAQAGEDKEGEDDSLVEVTKMKTKQAEAGELSKFHVLVIENDPFCCFCVEQMCEELSYRCSVASTVTEADLIFEERQVDLAYMDFHLASGFNAIDYLRLLKRKGVSVVAMSADDTVQQIDFCLRDGLVLDYIVKPVTLKDIQSAPRYKHMHSMRLLKEEQTKEEQTKTKEKHMKLAAGVGHIESPLNEALNAALGGQALHSPSKDSPRVGEKFGRCSEVFGELGLTLSKDAELEAELLAQAIAALSQDSGHHDEPLDHDLQEKRHAVAVEILLDLQQKRRANTDFYQQVLTAASQAL